MTRPTPISVARRLVRERFPAAEQAWLGGSVVRGEATATSDLDITVLDRTATAHRNSLRYGGWPVELFVHSEASIRHFVAKDLKQRKPSMARLVAEGVPLLTGSGGQGVRTHCEQVLADGPGPLSADVVDQYRYALSDLVDDVRGDVDGVVGTAIAVETWRRSADLILGINGRWSGGGKWLMREILALDAALGTRWAVTLDGALRSALNGDSSALLKVAEDVLEAAGGRLWEGFQQVAVIAEEARSV